MAEPIKIKEVSKPFKEISKSHKHNILANIMKAIELATRNQPEQFFEYLLESPVGKTMILPKVYELKVKPVMKNISDHYETAAEVHKTSILSMVAHYFSLKELVSFGFPIAKTQYESARKKDKKKSRSTNPVKKPIRKDNELRDSIMTKVIQTCLENSKNSRAKRVYPSKVDHLDIPGYDTKKNYDLTKPKSDIYLAFKTAYPHLNFCRTSFYKNIPLNFIAPKALYKPPFKQPEDRHEKGNLNQVGDRSSQSNSINDAVILPPLSNPSHSKSEIVMGAPSLSSNSNYSNSANTIETSSLPSNQNHTSLTSDLITSHPPYNSLYLNSSSNVGVPPQPYNLNYPNPTSYTGAPSLPSNANQPDSISNMRAPFKPN